VTGTLVSHVESLIKQQDRLVSVVTASSVVVVVQGSLFNFDSFGIASPPVFVFVGLATLYFRWAAVVMVNIVFWFFIDLLTFSSI
jgi:hypothetical protein